MHEEITVFAGRLSVPVFYYAPNIGGKKGFFLEILFKKDKYSKIC